ncbi:MAG: YihY/virulence factor BrkB family protein [Acidimicrobiia bacterium]|jgi:membrane protein
MTSVTALPPIPGDPIDPPPKETPELVQNLEESDSAGSAAAGVGYRAMARFNHAQATLLAAGTTYYQFLSLFSLIALGYGITALVDADQIAAYLTQAVSEAFPGLLGDDGIDPAQLRSVGQAASVVGLGVMLYAGSGAMVAASGSIHQIYGAPPDPRNFVKKRLRLLGWLVVIGTLIAFSLVGGTLVLNFADSVMANFGIEGSPDRYVVRALAAIAVLAVDYLIVHLMLSRMGGIRPPRRALVLGAAAGGLVIQLLRIPMALIVDLSTDKPQYGALAIPIGVLLVLYLNSMTLYGAAALTAGFAERDVPIDEIVPSSDVREVQADVDGPDHATGPSVSGGTERDESDRSGH